MKTDNSLFDYQQSSNGNNGGISSSTKKDRYQQAVLELESRQSEFSARLETRKQEANGIRDRHLSFLDAKESEHKADRTQVKQKLDGAKLDLEAAHRSASEHCSEIGVRYVPGKTTEVDVLSVPLLEEAAVAKNLGLPFGVGFSDRLVGFLKPVLTVLCWFMSSLSLGLGFRLLEAKNIFANPIMVCLSLVMGGVVAIGLLLSITPMWKSLGVKIASGRPTKEVIALLVPVAIATAVLMLGLAFLDAKAVILLNAARAALNPTFAIPMEIALLIGAVISGVYVLGLAATSFAESYTAAAKKSIYAEIKADENVKRDASKQTVPIRKALEALADVKVAEEVIQQLENDLRRMDGEFKGERAEILASIPQAPTKLEPDELKELTDLRDRARAAKTNLDAHIESRGGIPTGNDNTN